LGEKYKQKKGHILKLHKRVNKLSTYREKDFNWSYILLFNLTEYCKTGVRSLLHTVTGSRYADCHCYPTAGYIVTAAGATEFPEICAAATQRKAGYEFHIRSND
jgi:hypothetical protein